MPHLWEVVNSDILVVREEDGICFLLFNILFFLQKRKRDSRGRKCQKTIGDRAFVSVVQFYLHKCGVVTLGRLKLYENGLTPKQKVPKIVNRDERKIPLPDVPIPANVKNFDEIFIMFAFTPL
jgi:hypothetical protein